MTRPCPVRITPLMAGLLGAGLGFLLAVLVAFTLLFSLSFPAMKWLYSVGIGGWLFGAEGFVGSFPSALLGVVVGLFVALSLPLLLCILWHANAGSTAKRAEVN